MRIRDLRLNAVDAFDISTGLVDDLAGLALLPLLLIVAFLLVALLPILFFAAELLLILLVVVPLGVLLVVVGVRRHLVLLVRERDDAVVRSALVRGPVASWRTGRRFAALVRDGRAEEPATPRSA